MGAPVVHFEPYGKDAEALQDFYRKAFDWHVDTSNPMAAASSTPMRAPGSTAASRRASTWTTERSSTA